MKLQNAIVAMVLTSSFSVSFAETSKIVLESKYTSGDCPTTEIVLSVDGESYATGVKFTADVKNMLQAPLNVTHTVERRGAFYGRRFEGKLWADFDGCVVDFETKTIFNDKNKFSASIRNGKLTFNLLADTLRIDYTSTYNNQIIFGVSEHL